MKALPVVLVLVIGLVAGCTETPANEPTPRVTSPARTTSPAPTWTPEEEAARTAWLEDLEAALGNHIETFGSYMDSGSTAMSDGDYDRAESRFGQAENEATDGQADVQPVTSAPAPGMDTLADAVDAYFADAIKYADYAGQCAANYERSGWTSACDSTTTYAHRVDADQDKVIRELNRAR